MGRYSQHYFYFNVFDRESGRALGGGVYAVWDDEEGVERAHREWARHHPTLDLHVEQITSEQYGPLHTGGYPVLARR